MLVRPIVFRSVPTAALLLALSVAAARGAGAGQARDRSCGTPAPTAEETAKLRATLDRALLERPEEPVGGTIQIAFHVIHDGARGEVPDEQILDQIRVLNRDFLGTGYRFSLASVDRTESRRWFKLGPFTSDERQMKRELAADPAHRLNVYTCDTGNDLLGWAHFPFSYAEDSHLHGVVIHHGSLPGGSIESYDLGKTLTHEVGHYLGLFHTFEGGCEGAGDHVEDTPPEATPSRGCPESRNTCASPGDDPIHNYMDYSSDDCYTDFTAGQDARMDAIVRLYRPSLIDAPPVTVPKQVLPAAGTPLAPRALAFRGAWPNPFRDETVLRFSLPRSAQVRLRIYDVAGHLVASVLDAMMPAGDHSAPFRGAGLPAGVYYASLHVEGAALTRSLVHIP